MYKFNRYISIDDNDVVTELVNDGSKKDDKFKIGFLAQDILDVESDINCEDYSIVESENPDKLGLNETSLIPILVNAIKELKERIEILEGSY